MEKPKYKFMKLDSKITKLKGRKCIFCKWNKINCIDIKICGK